VYESFTRPEARGLGVYPFALLGITDRIASERLDTVWVAAEEDNPASLKAISKAGFTEAFRVSFRRRFGRLEIDEPTGPKAAIAAALLSDPSGLPGFGG
jgi:hypothetical protein